MNYYHTPGVAAKLFRTALIIATVLVHGTAITSLGLALATWIPRQGRAVALRAVVCFGWIFLIMAALNRSPGRIAEALSMLSPIFTTAGLCESRVPGQPHFFEIRMWPHSGYSPSARPP